ncbi:MAG: NAD-dependent epimerase/dehydratase family protein [Polyangiaceae bacterium]|nr:NAD-dependent epimerase/dehydratase family protein [Polyangiaceae bacterium]
MTRTARPRDMTGERVLVTGGLGFIGSNVVHRCLELGAAVTVYDCLDPRSGGNMRNVSDIEARVEIVLNDVRSLEGISACIRGKTIVFNCAAYTSHPLSMLEPLIDIDVNCKGTINVLEAIRRFNGDVRLVHVGTSTQVGRMHSSPVDEAHPEFPRDIYSANKTVSEKYVLIYGGAYRLSTCVVRLANVYGPRSNIRNPDLGFVNYFVGLALRGKSLTVFGDGRQLRNLSYVEDVTDALILAAQSQSAAGEVLFAVSDQQYSVAEIARAIVAHIGGEVRFVDWPSERQAMEVGDAVISNAKIQALLGWEAHHDLASGLGRTAEYFRPRLDAYL